MSADASSSGVAPTGAARRAFARRAGRVWLPALSLALLLVFAEESPAQSVSAAERADTILIVKHERKLYLLHDNTPLRSYRIALGLSPTGAKEREWDFRTPEGSYIIDFRQEHSRYFKALHISYQVQRTETILAAPIGGQRYIHSRGTESTEQAGLVLQNPRLDQWLHRAVG